MTHFSEVKDLRKLFGVSRLSPMDRADKSEEGKADESSARKMNRRRMDSPGVASKLWNSGNNPLTRIRLGLEPRPHRLYGDKK